ncbi:MAG: DPP IV N-terminal domain-containing protein [Kiritimatiellales bacterium]|nr:DPP IV N-terminal domain-containing protein [Kiritimatiellales bacterium]
MKRALFILGVVAVAVSASAQRVDIVKPGDGKTSISFAGFKVGGDSAARTFSQTLQADLIRSGWFRVSSQAAEVSLIGSCAAIGTAMKAECQVFKTASRQRLLGKAYQSSAAETRALAHRVADEIILSVTGHKGMASAKIALVGNRTKKKELYICDADGKNLRQITNDRSIIVGPKWGPDGTRLTYTSYMRGFPDIYMVNLQSGRRSRISGYGGLNASGVISPDGRTLAMILSRDGNPELYIKDLATNRLKRLTNTRRANEASPCWSPDGRHLAFVSDQSGRPQIYVISANGGQASRLTSSGSENVAPDWGANGLIAFASRIGGRYRVCVVNPVAKTLQVLETDWADYEDPSWAPDGRHILCSRTVNYQSSIYLLDTLKDSPVPLISGSGEWYSPSCTP